ncbi:MAG: hypothetical protein ACRD2T_05415, partial [Thermoanaerobaculia bacterium]
MRRTLERTVPPWFLLFLLLPSTSLPAEAPFVRGDLDGADGVSITDPIALLGFLVQGSAAPACADAADANNDSRVDVTDPIYTFGFLFLGGPAFEAPYPECGIDAGPADLLGCGPGACPRRAGIPPGRELRMADHSNG